MELKTIGLTKKYGSKAAVNALDITLTNGVYGLLGANGAGKTTLMRLLCNIQRPTSGKILLDGRNIVELGEKYRNLLGYLPQHFGYYPDFSAFDFLLYVSALKTHALLHRFQASASDEQCYCCHRLRHHREKAAHITLLCRFP